MIQPTVSVIIPVFNAEQYIQQCINSVIAQDYPNLEILIIDDGSADNSYALCRKICAEESQKQHTQSISISVFHQENRGVSSARNFGIEKSTGELITFVDADDIIDKCHISKLTAALGRQNDCAVSGYSLDYAGRTDVRAFSLVNMDAHSAMLNMLNPELYQGFLCNKLFRKAIILQHGIRLREDIFYCEDLLFCADYFRFCRAVSCTDDATYHYRQHRNSAVNSSDFSCGNAQRMMTGVAAFLECEKLYSEYPDIGLTANARAGTECARIYRKLYCGKADRSFTQSVLDTAYSYRKAVVRSPLGIKEKIKYLSTCIIPRISAKFWNARETRYL